MSILVYAGGDSEAFESASALLRSFLGLAHDISELAPDAITKSAWHGSAKALVLLKPIDSSPVYHSANDYLTQPPPGIEPKILLWHEPEFSRSIQQLQSFLIFDESQLELDGLGGSLTAVVAYPKGVAESDVKVVKGIFQKAFGIE